MCKVDNRMVDRSEIYAILNDMLNESTDRNIVEDVLWFDLSLDTINSYRKRHKIHYPSHPWENLDDAQYLIRIGAAGEGRDDKVHATLEGLLMFGYEEQIRKEYPKYSLKYIEYDSSSNIDRIEHISSSSGTWSGNIYDFFFIVLEKLYSQLSLPLKLQTLDSSIVRIPYGTTLFTIREALANCFTNADFSIPSGVVITSAPNYLKFSNPGEIRIGKKQMLQGGISEPRNKAIMKMFTLIGIGERIGLGIPEIFRIWENKGLTTPEITEDQKQARITITLPLEYRARSTNIV